jgi:probable HAF family extracellular repeat protein
MIRGERDQYAWSMKHTRSLRLVAVSVWALGCANLGAQTSTTGGYTITPLDFVANAINGSGQVAGTGTGTNGQTHAFLYSSGQTRDLGTLPGGDFSEALGLNSLGQVVGDSTVADGATHAFLYANGQMTDLGTLPRGYTSYATGINDAGQIVGWSDTTPPGYSYPMPEHAFLYSNEEMADLGSLGSIFAVWSHARAINASGQVVGWSTLPQGFATHAFLYSGGDMLDLGTFAGQSSSWAAGDLNSDPLRRSRLIDDLQINGPALTVAGGVKEDLPDFPRRRLEPSKGRRLPVARRDVLRIGRENFIPAHRAEHLLGIIGERSGEMFRARIERGAIRRVWADGNPPVAAIGDPDTGGFGGIAGLHVQADVARCKAGPRACRRA